MVAVASPRQDRSDVGIGASEIATIVGENPFESPWSLWMRKTGRAPDKEETPPMRWGKLLESAIRAEYVERNGVTVHVPPGSLYHADYPWARATPDGVVLTPRDSWLNGAPNWSYLVQIKNVGAWVHKAWQDEPPAYVVLQEQWELWVTGLQRADIAVLIGGNDYREYTVWRDDKMIADLVALASDFWRRIVEDREPPVDDSDACAEALVKRATGGGVLVPRSEEVDRLVEKFRLQRLTAKQLAKDIDLTKNRLRKLMADAQADGIETESFPLRWGHTAGHDVTNWEAIAMACGAPARPDFKALLAEHTKTTAPTRSILAPSDWDRKDKSK